MRRILGGREKKQKTKKKNNVVTLLLVDFSKALDSIHRGKLEQLILAYGLPKETDTVVMMLYRNTEVKVGLPSQLGL